MAARSVVPLNLCVNDIKQHILTVDSRFRDSAPSSSCQAGSGASDFFYTLLTPVKNVLRIRITSFEFPNNYHIFTKARKNVSFQVHYTDATVNKTFTLVIPNGNYSAYDMVSALNSAFKLPGGLSGETAFPNLQVAFDLITGTFTFTGPASSNFILDTTYDVFDRPYEYGLGYFLGFTCGKFQSVLDGSGSTIVRSNILANFAGDPYILLRINDFECVRHNIGGNDITAMAKIVMTEPKNYMTFDDYSGKHIKEIVFPTPQNLSRLHIQILDPYGIPLDLNQTQVSFSLEVLEIKSLGLYNAIRDSFIQL